MMISAVVATTLAAAAVAATTLVRDGDFCSWAATNERVGVYFLRELTASLRPVC